MGGDKSEIIFYDSLNYFQEKDFNCLKRDYVENLIHALDCRNGSDKEVIDNYSFFDFYNSHLENKENFADVRLSKLVKRIFEESKKERVPFAYTIYEDRLEKIKNEVENDSSVIEYEYGDF